MPHWYGTQEGHWKEFQRCCSGNRPDPHPTTPHPVTFYPVPTAAMLATYYHLAQLLSSDSHKKCHTDQLAFMRAVTYSHVCPLTQSLHLPPSCPSNQMIPVLAEFSRCFPTKCGLGSYRQLPSPHAAARPKHLLLACQQVQLLRHVRSCASSATSCVHHEDSCTSCCVATRCSLTQGATRKPLYSGWYTRAHTPHAMTSASP